MYLNRPAIERPGLASQRSRKRHFFHRRIFKLCRQWQKFQTRKVTWYGLSKVGHTWPFSCWAWRNTISAWYDFFIRAVNKIRQPYQDLLVPWFPFLHRYELYCFSLLMANLPLLNEIKIKSYFIKNTRFSYKSKWNL